MGNFGFSYQAPDYVTRAQAGVTLDPDAPDQTPQPVAAQAPQPTMEPYKPSILNVLADVLMNGKTPADAAMADRQRNYALQSQQLMLRALQAAPPDQRLAMMLNPGKLGEAMASHATSMVMKEGETRDDGSGGRQFTAPKLVFDDKSGTYGTQLPGSYLPTGQNGGDFSVSPTGAVVSGRTGLTGQRVALPILRPMGSALERFTPGVSGPGSPGGATPAQGQPPASATPGALIGSGGKLDPMAFFKSFVLPHEGGLNPRDLNGSPTNFGINQAANPGVDVTKLSPDDAASIFANKYFATSGAAHLPPALAAVHADTAFINPSKAAEFLTKSGGDPTAYMDLREAWMNGLVNKFPAAQQYAAAWSKRNADLRNVAGQLGGGQAAGSTPSDGSSIQTLVPATPPRLLDESDPRMSRFPKGSVVQQAPNGDLSVVQAPEFSPSERSKMREQFLSSKPYQEHVAAASALQALQHNIGQMTGPAAYTLLDTMARTINPGAVARQGTISAIEDMMGLPAHVVGQLLNIQGHGKIPLQSQQDILNAVTPFAQSHWDQAKALYDANASIATKNKLDPDEVVAPIGNRPQGMSVQVPPPQQRRGDVLYSTPRGPMRWVNQNGVSGWAPAS